MALLNIFKKKKAEKKEIKKALPVEKKAVRAKPVKRKAVAPAKPRKVSEIAFGVLKKPQVTEKATDLTNLNQYVFQVERGANKKDIKRSIEDIYGVDVLSVRVITIPAKRRRLGRTEGWRREHKKAIVKLGEGQKIEVLPR